MKLSRVVLIIVVIVVIAIIALFAYVILAPGPSTSSTWNSAADYPLNVSGTDDVAGQQCVNSTNYIYCIGGQDYDGGPRNNVYSSNPLSSSSSNITSWTSDSNSYPQDSDGLACVTYSSNVYCIGGTYDDAGDDLAASYYASLSNGQVGTWTNTTSYPTPADTLSCVTSSSYIYCVGGTSEPDGTNASATGVSSVWYAPISSTGIGSWTMTTSYPSGIYYADCFASQGYIYCLGGGDSNNNAVNSVYYASLSSSGVGSWNPTTAYPQSVSGQSCVIISSVIYCVGGEGSSNSYTNAVYYAVVSSTGIGAWQTGPGYPDSLTTECVAVSGSIYCAGGFDGSEAQITAQVDYTTLSSITTTTTT